MAKLSLTPVDPRFSSVHFNLGNDGDATPTSNHACRVLCFSRLRVLLVLRINTVNHQEMAEGQKIRERKHAKELEGKRTGDSKSLEKRCGRRQ